METTITDFQFPCPYCGKNLTVNTSIIGRKGRCKSCSSIVVVPTPKTVNNVMTSVNQETIGICPYCRTSIKSLDNVQICTTCKTPHHFDCWQENKGCTVYGCNNAPPEEEKITIQAQQFSSHDNSSMFLYVSVTRFIIMSIVTFGIYEAYWIYKNWSYLKIRDDLGIQPFWRGWFGFFYCHKIFKAIHDDPITNKYENANFSASGLATGWVIFMFLQYALGRSPEIGVNLLGLLIGLPSFIFFIPVQNYINRVNLLKRPKPEYYSWSTGHTLCFFFGLFCWFGWLSALSK